MNDVRIRMIFCDVDGTLLPHGSDAVHSDVFATINHAVSSNVRICIASGRSYPDLKRLFAPVADCVIFVCNDGALTVERDAILFSSPLNKSQVICMSKTYENDYETMIIYTKDTTYYISESRHFGFAEKISPEDISSIAGDIFKVAFSNLKDRAKIKLDNLYVKPGILNKVYEDSTWTEYITSQTDKGTAARELQNTYRISASETAAFGDNLNDLNMLRRARLSFAPENAHPEVIRMCKYKTNDINKEILNII